MKYITIVLSVCFLVCTSISKGQTRNDIKYPLGYSVDISKITEEKMRYARSLGITHLELAGIGAILDKNLDTIEVSDKWNSHIRSVRQILDKTGMKVWSVHMPFSKNYDISLIDEAKRTRVVAAHRNILKALQPLGIQIILFHPSY